MTAEEYIQQEMAAGRRAHCHHGVWWHSNAIGMCRPMLPFQLLEPGVVRPSWRHSFLGYSHLAPAGSPAARRAFFWVYDESRLRTYGLDSLNHANRKAVAKAQRGGLTAARLVNLEPWWEDLRALAMSMARRTHYNRPAEYYETHFGEWQAALRREFSKPGREWWGVFSAEGRLGAYMYSVFIEDTMHLLVTKVHSDFLPLRASDYLYFSMLEYARDLPGCRQVNTGRGSQAAGVDRFKAGHGFRPCEVGEYTTYAAPLAFVLKKTWEFERRHSAQACGAVRGSAGYRRALTMARRIAPADETNEAEAAPANSSDRSGESA